MTIGKTTLMTIYALWLAIFHPDQYIVIIANNNNTAKMILSRMRLAYLELPGWIKEPIEISNEMSMKLSNGSTIVTSPTTDSAIRGYSVSCLILDEFAFVEPGIAQEFWGAVTPTVATNPDAKIFISSTPNGIGNMFYEIADKARRHKNDFKYETVLWNDVPGRGKMWKKHVIETDLNGDVAKFEQEYECKFLGSSNSPFTPQVFEFIEKETKEPKRTDMDGKLKIWKEPENDRVYSIGVDISEGIGKDASVIQVFDMTDLSHIEQVATYRDNRIMPLDFIPVILEVADLYGKPVMSVERNGCGTRCL